jgi:hypothetical protein
MRQPRNRIAKGVSPLRWRVSPCVVRPGARRRSLSALAAATFKAGLLAEVDQRSRRRVKRVANGGVDDGGIPAARQGFEEIDEACSGGPGYARTKDGETGDLLGAGGLTSLIFRFQLGSRHLAAGADEAACEFSGAGKIKRKIKIPRARRSGLTGA